MSKPADPPRPHLLPDERRRLIAEYVDRNGRATVQELAKRFHTSAVTIRGDLDVLANAALIVRSHGGALPRLPVSNDAPVTIKETRHQAQKQRIGAAAARLIRDGETIILDSGSTTMEIARQIRQRKFESLTVITNALNIALELSGQSGVRVMMLGGMLRPTSYSLVGPDAQQALSKLSADRLFLGVDGLDPEIGVTTPDPLESALNALMIRVARRTIAVMDASKLGQRSLSVIAPIRQLHKVITDRQAAPDLVEALHNAGIEVELA